MASLYQLNNAYAQLQQMIEEGQEGLEDTLASITDAVEEKLEAYAMVIKNIESDVEGIKSEEKRLAERRKVMENGINRMKQAIAETLGSSGQDKLKTEKFTFSFRKSSKVEVSNIDSLPQRYVKVERTISRADLAKALKAGEQIEGVQLVENQSLSIR
ncbi:siphovirus Gp157 family protein [Lysinibacillus sphaericus]|uniref:Siphovirus Gp157 family protein n=1 Tax=Lysinibacillus sphaericus TaxID=1421 RepID=A0A544U8D7_LYSSH|nr:siphovirus Gp157 family protein [Lysinibacillus sp. SDF0037]TQR28353.1 siphovirus Gp157 family protein [Lysinibacillus sp. SDF0037]